MHVPENTEVITPEEPQKPQRKLQKTILDCFSKLTNEQESVRVKNGSILIKYLCGQDADSEERHFEIKYALKRLIRGLGASRVRAGFYATLVGLISTIDVPVSQILEVISTELLTSGRDTKGEKGEIYTGQVLACGAIVRSNLFLKGTAEEQEKIIEILINAANRRSYLSLTGCSFLSDLLERIDGDEFESVILPHVKAQLTKPFDQLTIDNLYLLIVLWRKYPRSINKKFLKKCLNVTTLMNEDNLKSLANILVSNVIVTLKHPVYEAFSKLLVENKELIVKFVEEVDACFTKLHRNKLTIATVVFTHIVNNMEDISILPELLQRNFVHQTLNHFKSSKGKQKDTEYEQVAQQLFNAVLEALKKGGVTNDTKVAVLGRLLFDPGTFIFEKVTKSKLVQQITALLEADGVKTLAESYRDVVLARKPKENPRETWWNNDRIYAAQLLVKLLGHPSLQAEIDWKTEQLKFLMQLGLFKDEATCAVGAELAASIKDTFFRALDIKLTKLEDLHNLLYELLIHLNSRVTQETIETVLRNPINAETYELFQKTVRLVEKLKKKATKKKNSVKTVFLTLFLHMALQLFNDVKLATDSLSELFCCYDKLDGDKNEQQQAEDDPLWIEVVVDLFLNLLSHNSHLLRSVINCVFPHLCPYLNATALHQILSVLDPKTGNPLSYIDSESEEDSEDSEADEDVADTEEDKAENEEDEEDIAAEDDDDDDEKETINDKLRMAVREALGTNGYQTDEESVDIDDLGEEEGKQLDEALASAFKQFKPNLGKKERDKQTKEDEALTHFRIRVLDLVESYLDSASPSMTLTLEMAHPLLQCLEFCVKAEHQKPLQDRLRACLRKLTNLKKFGSFEGIDETVFGDLLRSLLEQSTKSTFVMQDMGDKVAECCVFIVRCAQQLQNAEETPKKTKKRLKKVIGEVLLGELDVFFQKRDCLTPIVLFRNLLQSSWEGSTEILPKLVEYAFNESARPFKRSQALDLLKLFYMNHRHLSANKEIFESTLNEELHSTLNKKLINILGGLASNTKIKEKFVCNLFNVLVAIKRCPLNTDSVIDWPAIGEKIREYRSQVSLSKDGKVAYKKVCNALGVSPVVHIASANGIHKHNVNGQNKEENDDNKKHKKRKRGKANNEARKLKKEAKLKRLEGTSDDLFDVSSFYSAEGNKKVKRKKPEGDENINGNSVKKQKSN